MLTVQRTKIKFLSASSEKKCRVRLGIQSRDTFFCHSALLSLSAVLLRKLPINKRLLAEVHSLGLHVVGLRIPMLFEVYS